MRIWKSAVAIALALMMAVPAGATQGEDTVRQRQEDLDALYTTLEGAHPDLFANTPEEVFLARKGEIQAGLAEMDDVTFALELQSLTALAGDSHTSVAMGSALGQAVRYYPLALTWRDGGWYLTTATADSRDLLGQEVTALNGRTMEEIVTAFGRVLSADNPVKLRRQYRQTCNVANFYEYLGLVERGEAMALTFAGGRTLEVDPVPAGELGAMEIVRLSATVPQPATAEQDRNYVAFPLNEATYYIQYNACAEDPDLPMADFAARVRADLDGGDYGRILLDLRNNGGGSDGVIWPLLAVLRQEMDRGKQVVGLIGEATFSSAIINAVELQEMGAPLVGERTSGSVDHFGAVRSFRLPNSGLQVGVSSQYIDLGTLLDADAGREVEPLEPDILVAQTMPDTLKGRDTAVEWLLANPQRLEQKEYPDAPLTRGRFAALLWQAAGSPETAGESFDDALGIEWYLPALTWARASGVAAGTGEGLFQASRPITRQEAATMLVGVADLLNVELESGAVDLTAEGQPAPWAEGAVLRLAKAGWTAGAMDPTATMTREEGQELVHLLGERASLRSSQ